MSLIDLFLRHFLVVFEVWAGTIVLLKNKQNDHSLHSFYSIVLQSKFYDKLFK